MVLDSLFQAHMMNPFQCHRNPTFAIGVWYVWMLFEAVGLQLVFMEDLPLLMVLSAGHSAEEVAVLHFTAAELTDWLAHSLSLNRVESLLHREAFFALMEAVIPTASSHIRIECLTSCSNTE